MRYLVSRKPNRAVRTMDIFSEMDRMMNSVFNDTPEWDSRVPSVDIREEENRYLLEAELPGYTEKDVHLRVEENLLVLEANRKGEKEDKEPGYLVRERSSASYKRSFVLPKDVDSSKISASMKNGVLSLELQKSEAAKPKTIEIKVK